MGETFNSMAIRKDLTPTLYKMINILARGRVKDPRVCERYLSYMCEESFGALLKWVLQIGNSYFLIAKN